MMMADRINARENAMRSIVSEIRDAPCLSVRVWCPHGEEHYVGDMDGGTYWKPANITVEGDMTDMATLRVLNSLMDKHGLKVHTCRGHAFSEKSRDGYARLVPKDGEWA